jgi:hypothetical protein
MEMKMEIQIASDYHDYYDIWMDREGFLWERYAHRKNFGRRDQFSLFDQLRIKHPMMGVVGIMDPGEIVVYTDEFKHCGLGKVRSSSQYTKYGGKLYSRFIKSAPQAMSFRDLWIGNSRFFLQYVSDDKWRSNVGNVMITQLNSVYSHDHLFPNYDRSRIYSPIFAFDYVRNQLTEEMLAVDFNTAPGLRGTPIEKMYSGEFVAGLIKEWFASNTGG